MPQRMTFPLAGEYWINVVTLDVYVWVNGSLVLLETDAHAETWRDVRRRLGVVPINLALILGAVAVAVAAVLGMLWGASW